MMADSPSSQKAVAPTVQKAKVIGARQLEQPDEEFVAVSAAVQYFQGPLPPPEVLKGYEEALPGTAERIVTMAEDEACHRREMQRFKLGSDAKLEARGQTFGFWLAAIPLAGGMVLIGLDKPVIGTAAVIAAIAGLSGLFVWARGKGRDQAPPKRKPT